MNASPAQRLRTPVLLVTSLVFSLLAAMAYGEVVNRVLLRVNDRIITLYDYQVALAERRAQIARAELEPDEQRRLLEEAPLQVMRSLFDRLLIFSRADQLALTVSEIEVDEAARFQLEQNGIENEEQLRTALLQSGLTLEQFRAQLRQRLLWEKVTARELLPRLQVSDEELRKAYEEQSEQFVIPEQRKLREIVVLDTSGLSEAERQALAERMAEAWRDGGDPEQLAAENPEQATFIDIGWVERGDLNADLAAAAFGLEAGAISPPIASRGGLHVVQNLEIRESTQRPYEEVRDQLLRFERARRYDEELDEYLAELEEKSYFRSDLPAELQGFRTKSGKAVREDALQIFGSAAEDEAATEEDP